MKVVFFGTPDFAVPSLRALLDAGHDVRAVITQPDRPKGRSRSVLKPPPVKVAALDAGLPVHQPLKPIGDEFEEVLRAADADVGIVVAYGHILRPHVLAVPPLGMLNVHASLLPRWRGAAPVQWAILADDPETGVSIMQMESGLDTGPVFAEARTAIDPRETSGELLVRLAHLGASLLTTTLPDIATRRLHAERQDAEGMTYATKIDRASARLDFSEPAHLVAAKIRGMDPAPGAWAMLGDTEVKLFGGHLLPGDSGIGRELSQGPGATNIVGDLLVIRAADRLCVGATSVQLPGKPRMSAADFSRGHGTLFGARFS